MAEQNPERDTVQGGGAVILLRVNCGLQVEGEAGKAEAALWVEASPWKGRARESVGC